MINKEIERKFLVEEEKLPDLSNHEILDVSQGYICAIDEEYVFRLRQVIKMSPTKELIGTHYYQTIKGAGSKEREEYDAEIPQGVFSTFWPACKNLFIHKLRYDLPIPPRFEKKIKKIHLDIYKNSLNGENSFDLKGRYTVEVEFFDRETCDSFKPFDWFGEEVTEDHLYTNVNLARFGWPD